MGIDSFWLICGYFYHNRSLVPVYIKPGWSAIILRIIRVFNLRHVFFPASFDYGRFCAKLVSGCLFVLRFSGWLARYWLPQLCMAFRIGSVLWPSSVRRYSTCGGTYGKAWRCTIPSAVISCRLWVSIFWLMPVTLCCSSLYLSLECNSSSRMIRIFHWLFSSKIVVMAVPYPALASLAKQYQAELAGKIVVDITNPLNFETWDELVVPADSSAA